MSGSDQTRGSDDRPRGSLFDALRDRRRTVTTEVSETVAGIPGALFAVPVAAFVNVVAVYLSQRAWETGESVHGDMIWSTVPRPRRRRA